MKKTFSSKKSAFSLIELSIVLIIIGLLIAGITGGASLIKSSELRSIMGEARGYAVAVNSFFTQYDRYPGDSDIDVGSNSKCVGDRDNTIEYSNGADCAEGLDAWNDLKDIGAIDLALTLGDPQVDNNAPPAMVPVTNIPGSKIKGAGWAFDYLSSTSDSSLHNVVVLTGTTTNKAKLLDVASASFADRAAVGIISPGDALSIDSKIDDGKSDTGNVKGWDKNAVAGESGACRGASGSYKIDEGSKKNCAMSFRVDVSS